MNGGGQERGLRSGTVPAPLAVGMGAAAKIAKQVRIHENSLPCRWSCWLCGPDDHQDACGGCYPQLGVLTIVVKLEMCDTIRQLFVLTRRICRLRVSLAAHMPVVDLQ